MPREPSFYRTGIVCSSIPILDKEFDMPGTGEWTSEELSGDREQAVP